MRKLYKAILLLMLFAGVALGQGKGNSVIIFNNAEPKSQARVVADYLVGQIGKGLLNQYSCVDWIDDESMRALVGWERWRQLLGGEPNDEMLQNLAGAVGARYIVVVTATTLPNGQTTVSAKILDSQTGRMLANRMEAGESAEASLDNAQSVAQKIMQDLGSVFKNQCDVHWKGTISYTHLKQVSQTETWVGSSSGTLIPNVKITQSTSEKLEETSDLLLQALTLGSSGDTTMSRVAQKYIHHWERIRSESGTTPCREPGRNPYRKEVSGEEKEVKDESGQSTETVSVVISIAPTGNYQIKVYKIEPMLTKGQFQRSGNIMGCKPNPFSSFAETQGSAGVGYINLQGQVDPKNPDILMGKKVEGNLENGQKTWTWNLRLVKPRSRTATHGTSRTSRASVSSPNN